MHGKAERKRLYILEQARKVFAEKGFKMVTMKDIVSACGISRGGVYLYFSSTEELFEAVLRRKAETEQDPFSEPTPDTMSASGQLERFLNAQKSELLHPADSLILATYEYLFAQGASLDKTALEAKFQRSVQQLSGLIQAGVEQGEFSAEPRAAACDIIFLLEGLRISSTVLSLDEAFLDQQMGRILLQLQGGTSR